MHARPEQFDIGEKNMIFKKCESDSKNRAGKIASKKVPPVQKRNKSAEFEAVYAAPDVLEKMRRNDGGFIPQSPDMEYPLNNAEMDRSRFLMVYAAPDAFDKMREIRKGDKNGNGMAVVDASADLSEADKDKVTCPVCGEKSRPGKFCEWCGSVLE